MLKRCVTFLAAIFTASPLPGWGGAFDGLAGILQGHIRWFLDYPGVTGNQVELYSLGAFQQDQWGLRDSDGEVLAGFYSDDSGMRGHATLELSAADAEALTGLFALQLDRAFNVAAGSAYPYVQLTSARAVASASGQFDQVEIVLDLSFGFFPPGFFQAATGGLEVRLSGPAIGGPAAGGLVIVNDAVVKPRKLAQLERRAGFKILPGRYWYDRRSGLWGLPGGPSLGQIRAGLALGGRLKRNASGDQTAVQLNGRTLHPVELAFLEARFGSIRPGRYTLNGAGNVRAPGGVRFNLSGGSSGGGAGTGRSILGHSLTGSVIGDSTAVGFIDGSTGVTCGPDGGCIY